MHRLLILLLLFVSAGLNGPAAAQTGTTEGLPPRPTPFRFVNDQAQLMAPGDAKKLESGLRRYADNNGTQIVVVTVPTLAGRDVADYGRALGRAWGIGQRDKNNGIVVLLSAQDHKLTIQPGSGVQAQITPEVTSRAISKMTPAFKQGNYFGGLRAGLNTLMLAANPSSVSQATTAATSSSASSSPASAETGTNMQRQAKEPVSPTPNDPLLTPPTTEPDSGPGMGTVLLGALVVGGIIWLLVRMLRGRSQPAAQSRPAPDFLPNRNPDGGSPNGPVNMQRGGSNFGGGGGGGNFGGGGGGGMGSGMGGILATGAAAAAGAYLGNRMASGHEAPSHGLAGDGTTPQHFDPSTAAGAAGAGAMGTGAADDYFSGRDSSAATSTPDYFSDDATADNSSNDFFSSDDNSSYDDPSSGDSGGGGFDSGNDNSGSW
ncbi:TPM domain-containing protein [Hymenobacter sedentarius]|uniref:TPM domain-containing protein n=1 Tax=Hymenobacter sedentarius TaxID=1411621 RepID=UPI0009EA8B83|nr:TPM domain-containing protein [Hymenobacter sedentarius]